MEAADSSSNKPSTVTAAGPPAAAAPDRAANATAASNVMSSLAGLGSTSSEDEKLKEKDVGGTSSLKEPSSGPLPSQQQQHPKQSDIVVDKDTKAALGSSVDNSAATKSSEVNTSDAMEVDEPTTATSVSAPPVAASKQPSSTARNSPKSQPLSSPSKPQQSAKMKARGIISTLEASADSAFASKPAALPSATTTGGTGDVKKKKKDKEDKKKTSKKKSSLDGKKGKDKVKKKKVRLSLYL